MKKLIGLLAFTVLFVLSLNAQNYFDIRLTSQSINCETNEVCYDVQIKSGNDKLWRFAGQNYRLFYNGALAEFTRVEGRLSEPYSQPEVVQNIQHLDLSEEGNLSFDQDISWLNYYIDMNAAHPGQILSPEVWTTTSTICFSSDVDLMGDPDLCFEMVWAREDLTFNYATAFVEVSEWVAENSTNDHVHGSIYHDLNLDNGDEACFAQTCGDTPPSYDSKITLKSTDTLNNISCYSIEIKSSNNRTWLLGDREFSFLFDGSQASFHSAISTITGSGSVSLGESLINQSFEAGSGNVTFEDNLSAIAFTIDQESDQILLSNEYVEVAELCLDFSQNTGDEECFEIVFGRSDLTGEYFDKETILYTTNDTIAADYVNFTDYNKCNAAPCTDLSPPTSNGDVRICEGEDLPELSVQEVVDLEIRWYATPAGGVPVAQGFTYEPTAPGIFYAETFDADKNCFSHERTAVALLEAFVPTLDISSKACTEDQSVYNLIFTTDANSVSVDQGNLEKLIGLEWTITDVPSGVDVVITMTNNITGCTRIETIEAPNCECQTVSPPVSQGDIVACLDDSYPSLSVQMVQENVTADWYTRIEGGTPLVTDQVEYTPNNISGTGEYIYYVETRSLENGCVSSTRTEIRLTVLEPPVYAFVGAECAEDLQSFTATFYSDATMIQSSIGTLTSNEDGIWTLSDVPAGENAELVITSPTGCMINKQINAPSCECDDIEAPICRGQIITCEGIDYEGFVAFVPKGYVINWYDSPVDGSLLAEGETFKPSLAGKYYAEAVDTLSGCVSMERAEVELIISPVPDLQVANTVLCAGDTIVWTELVTDLDSTTGSTAVFRNFRDAINNENAITETTLVIEEVTSYFFRKTSDAGCYDIETIIVIPENCTSNCLAEAGIYELGERTCFDGEVAFLVASEAFQANIPTGFTETFILSRGEEKEIFGVENQPVFFVDAPGIYRIHSVVFDPNDMELDNIPSDINTVDGLIEFFETDGSHICVSIDPFGAFFEVTACEDLCQAFAGSPLAGDIECLNGAPVELIVEMNPLDILIPEGFEQIYVLTTGPELTIMGAQNENFIVDTPGEYRVHSLVFDSLTLDLSIIEPGVTTGFDVFNLLIDGGGDICASLDLNGALFNVQECIDECTADAGNTSAAADFCVIADSTVALLAGISNFVVPEGFGRYLVMSTGEDQVIQTIEVGPIVVDAPGDYRIYSFVYNEETLDLSGVTFGETSVPELMTIIAESGVCASLDSVGAEFEVDICPEECLANAGNTIAQGEVCYNGEPVALAVDVSDDIVVPEGYVHTFLITEGSAFTVVGLQQEPFLIDGPGAYEVNSMVYDPSTFQLDSIEFGVTDFFDVYDMFIVGGGTVCGNIDFFGATFFVDECEEECTVELGEITYVFPTCYDSSMSIVGQIELSDVGDSQIPFDDGYEIIYLAAQDGIVIGYNGAPEFNNATSGEYSVHAMVFHPEAFSETNIVLGETSIVSLASEFISGGGSICGVVQETGESFEVEICVEPVEIDLELSKEISNTSPSIGEEVTFTISVENTSDQMATGIAVADRLPKGYTLSGNISDGGIFEESDSATEILWQGVVILPMTTERLTFTAIVNEAASVENYKNTAEVVAADQDDPDSTPNNDDGDQSEDDEDSVTPEVENPIIDLELIKTSSTASVQAGQQVNFNINLANRSMKNATGIAIQDILPEGIDFSSVTNISNNGELVENTIIWTDIEMGFLSSMNLTYTASIESDAAIGTIINIAQVTAADQADLDSTPDNDDGDQSEDDEDSSEISIIAPFIDLSLSKEVSTTTPSIGEAVTFTITVANDGIIPATDVIVTDVIPEQGYDLGSITNIDPVAQSTGNTLAWTINELAPNEEVVLSFDIVVNADGTDYKNTAQVSSANEQDSDSTPDNDDGDQSEDDEDSASVTPVVDEEIIDLEVDKNVSELAPTIGEVITYEVLIVNNGPFDATNVVLQDVTPDGIDAMDISGPHVHEDGVITWTIPLLEAGENMVFEYSSIVFESLTDEYTNVVQVMSADQEDIDSAPANDDGDQSEDDEASATIFPVVINDIDLELTKSVDNQCAGSSDRVTFTIEIFNNSDAIATGVSVEDVLSDGFTAIDDISSGGNESGSVIRWTGLSLLPGETISLSYSAMISTNGTTFVNTAQITAADQNDIDSAPNNDDGDQSEDDEASLAISGGRIFDLELDKLVDNIFAQPGDRVRFDITVRNEGCIDATGVAIRDIIPSGYKSIRNVSDFGVRDGNVIIWEDLSVAAGNSKTVSFTAEVVHFSINCDYINVAEILEADQDDIDSTPGNDDGDQSEDDEDSAEVFAGSMADLELTLSADKTEVETGDIITYTIQVCNNGPANATGVEIRDYLPEGVQVVGELSYKGEQNGQEISWSGFTFVVNTCLDITFQAEVLDASTTNDKLNAAEVVIVNELDPDSSPGNGDGDVAEDDYDEVVVTHFVALPAVTQTVAKKEEVTLNTALYLEGAYNSFTGKLNTTLNKLGYLPGQKPRSFFADGTPAGQPYKSAPWHYDGTEGNIYDYKSDFSMDYPSNVVDWVLVEFRTDKSASSSVLRRAALLLNDGSIMLPLDAEPIVLDAFETYYLVVQHRNHLPIMSPTALEVIDGQISFDFRKNESYTGLLGSGQKAVNGLYCVYAANGDQFKEAISEFDINIRDMDLWFESNGLNSAYMNADFDMNGDVNVNDQIMWLLNNGVFSDVPR